jgi:sugar-phosphatase
VNLVDGPAPSCVIAVAGVAGSGKTTLGRALATTLGLPLLDLDSVTNPLLDTIADVAWGAHWLAAPHQAAIRTGRYASLLAVAKDVVDTTGGCVLVAPWTSELRGGEAWATLEGIVGRRLKVIHLTGDPDLFALRRSGRSEPRDAFRPDVPDAAPPTAIPVISIDADLTTEQQLQRALVALGHRATIDVSNLLFQVPFQAVLFDLDGTLVDSTASVLRSWRRFADEFGVPIERVHNNHGQPAAAHIRSLLPEARAAEGLTRIEQIETNDSTTVTPIPGAQTLFDSIPEHMRAIVTSGSETIASARLRAIGFPIPKVFVTIDQVAYGKPDPEPFLLAARRLGADPFRCLVIEDSSAGVAAARRAGCHVLALAGTVKSNALAEADLVVDGLDRLSFSRDEGDLRLSLR